MSQTTKHSMMSDHSKPKTITNPTQLFPPQQQPEASSPALSAARRSTLLTTRNRKKTTTNSNNPDTSITMTKTKKAAKMKAGTRKTMKVATNQQPNSEHESETPKPTSTPKIIKIWNIKFDVEKVASLCGNKKGGGEELLQAIKTYLKGVCGQNKTALTLKKILRATEENSNNGLSLDWMTDKAKLEKFVYEELKGSVVEESNIYFFASISGRTIHHVVLALMYVRSKMVGQTGGGLMDSLEGFIGKACYALTAGYRNTLEKSQKKDDQGRQLVDLTGGNKIDITEWTPYCGFPSLSVKHNNMALTLRELVCRAKHMKKQNKCEITDNGRRCTGMSALQRQDVAGPLLIFMIFATEAFIQKIGRLNNWHGKEYKNGFAKRFLSIEKVLDSPVGASLQKFLSSPENKTPLWDPQFPEDKGIGPSPIMPEVYFVVSFHCVHGKKERLPGKKSSTNKRHLVDDGNTELTTTGWEDNYKNWKSHEEKMAEGSDRKVNYDKAMETALFLPAQYDVLLGGYAGNNTPRYVDFNCMKYPTIENWNEGTGLLINWNLRPPAAAGAPVVAAVAAAPPELREQLLATAPERQNPGATSGNPTDVVATEDGENDGAPPMKQARTSRNPAPNYGRR